MMSSFVKLNDLILEFVFPAASVILISIQYTPGERDMLVMVHQFEYEIDSNREKITSTMIDYGIPNGDSSMSRTVGLPAAIGVRMILDETITDRGVLIPVKKSIYEPVLKELEELNIRFVEKLEKEA